MRYYAQVFPKQGLLVTALGDTDAQYGKTRFRKTFCELKTRLHWCRVTFGDTKTSENLHASEIAEDHSPWSIF